MIHKYKVLKKSTLVNLAILIISVCSLNSVMAQGTIYIDPSYTGSQQNGSQQYPYTSWNSVAWTNGTTYLQKAGTTFNTSGSLIITSKNNITLGSYGSGNKPKIISSGASTSKVIDITSCYNMIITGLEVASTTGQVTAGIIIDGTGSSNNLIDNCITRDVQWGIRILTTSAGNRILNTEVYNTQDDGIYIKDTPDIEIGYCNIYNVNLKYFVNPDQSYSSGDNIQIASTNSHNFNVHHNTLDHSSTGNKFCFIAWGNNYTGTLEHNTMIGNSSQVTSCVYLSPTTGTVTVRYNSITNGNYGIYSYVANFRVYYNKFTSNKTAISVLNNYHLLAENNIFYNNINVAVSGLSGSQVISKNNIFYISGSSKAYSTNGSLTSDYNTFNTQYSGFINGYSTLAGWRSASGQDMHSMVANPQFVNPSTGDFRLQQSSPCINAGTVCGYVQDFFNNPVPSGNSSDIGYHEYQAATNNPPVIQNQSFSVPENSVNSTVVGQIVASDPNAGQTLTYAITSGNAGGAFAINPSTGVLTVADSQLLNFETTPQFTMQVTVTDNLNASSSANVTISLQDVNEQPSSGDQGFNIDENAANGTLVGTILASDPDQNQVLSYFITSGNTNNAFSINSQTGEICVASSSALVNMSTFNLTINVRDNGTPVMSIDCQATITVNQVNMPPVIQNQTFNVNENTPQGTTIGVLQASDPNAGQTLTFTIISGNSNNAFALSPSGVLSVANSSALNYEQLSSVTLTISVTDNGNPAASSQASVVVAIADINENPYIPAGQNYSVAYTAPQGTVIGTVSASDPDYNQSLTYSIINGNSSGAFTINSATGVISVLNSSALRKLMNKTITLTVKVTDNGIPQLADSEYVNIRVSRRKESDVLTSLENSLKAATVYPNPSSDGIFNFSIPQEMAETVKITILTMTGKQILNTEEVLNGSGVINLSGFEKGVYIMLLRTENNSETRKLIIQ